MTLDRKPALDAVHHFMREHQTNSVAEGFVWRAVQIALDEVEEQEALGIEHQSLYWVVLHKGSPRPLAVCSTHWRARRTVKQLQAAFDSNRRNYIITKVPGMEIVK